MNMWAIAAIALISIGGATCFNMMCFRKATHECENLLPRELPKTTGGLEHFCSEYKSYAKCAYEESENCEDNEEVTEVLKDTVDFLQKACDPDSRLYKVISSNLECLVSALNTVASECFFKIESREIKRSLYEQFFPTGEATMEQEYCVDGMFLSSCTSVQVYRNCGENVADAVIYILMNTDYRLRVCGEEGLHDNMDAIMATIMAIQDVEEDVENALKKKK